MKTPSEPHPDSDAPVLSAADAAALDALIAAGFDPAGVDPQLGPEAHARAARIAGLVGLTGSGDSFLGGRSSRIDATMARILRAGPVSEPALIPQDDAALEAWVMSGYSADRVPGSLRERARRHASLAYLVTVPTALGESGPRIDRVMQAVQRDLEAQETRMRIETERLRVGSGLRLADLISVAAVLLIAAAVIWPVFANIRNESRRLACESNLGNTGRALASYASAHADSLPIAAAGFDGPWWRVGAGPGRSNSANLYELTRAGYATLADLACPGNPAAPTAPVAPDARDWRDLDEVSYSYRVMSERKPVLTTPVRLVVMADRNPVIRRAVRGEWWNPSASSPNHAARGQHVLFNDGSTAWLISPELPTGDNIWLPRHVERRIDQIKGRPGSLKGTETPDGAEDAFVGP